jgi:hypothetical protein
MSTECQTILGLIGVLLLICLIIYYIKKHLKEGFVSKEAIELCNNSKKILAKDDKISFTDFKNKTGCPDVVVYDNVKRLYKKGNLTPENVQDSL